MLRTSRAPVGFALTLVAVASAACSGNAIPSTRPSAAATAAASTAAASKSPSLGSSGRPIVMAFAPSPDTARVTASGKSIAAALEKATGLTWDVEVPTSYSTTIDGMCAGQIDVAWLSALTYVLARQKNCADPLLATERYDENKKLSTTYDGQIVVRSDSGIGSLTELKGKKFAFVDPLSISGTLFPALKIEQATGQDPSSFFSQTVFAGSDSLAILAVYQGRVDGAASVIDARTLVEERFPDIMQRTKRIATAGPIPNDTVSIRKSFPADLRGRIQQALLDYAKSDAGRKALTSLYGIDGLATADPKAYDPVLEAVRAAGVTLSDIEKEAAATATPVATPAPSAGKTP